MILDSTSARITGHVVITNDDGTVLLDKTNAIHPQNMARIIARALSNEPNSFIHRIAFGNGVATVRSVSGSIYHKPANDGQSPDSATWESRIYNEIFSKVVDDGNIVLNPLLGQDLGSADSSTGVRSGGGANQASDPTTVMHISGPGVRSTDLGILSQVLIYATINKEDPIRNGGDPFVFDEIGLYTSGAQAISTPGYQYIDVGNKNSLSATGLQAGTEYSIAIAVNGSEQPSIIKFKTPSAGGSGTGGAILYGDLCEAFNTGSSTWGFNGANPLPFDTTLSITDSSTNFSTITGSITHGFLKVTSGTVGINSRVLLNSLAWDSHETISFIAVLSAGSKLLSDVKGVSAGLYNSPAHPELERERLLTHLVFDPITKNHNEKLNITYTLTIAVERTPSST